MLFTHLLRVAQDDICPDAAQNLVYPRRFTVVSGSKIVVIARGLNQHLKHLGNSRISVGECRYLILGEQLKVYVEMRVAVDMVVTRLTVDEVTAQASREVPPARWSSPWLPKIVSLPNPP